MKYKLINPVIHSSIEQILINRGIPLKEVNHYLNTTDEDINEPEAFGPVIRVATTTLITAISEEKNAIIIVDADCDGYTSSALLINYLYDLFPNWVLNHLDWYIHEDKAHGLEDCYKKIIEANIYDLALLPDSSSNDYDFHKKLLDAGIISIVLDHHEADQISKAAAAVVNNQLSDYPNKQLSGVGVAWQFCRLIDKYLNANYANNYLDLVALGLVADMQSMTSFETKHLIIKGFKDENIKNPFIYYMAEKNKFSLGDHITPMGAAFYIAPFVNAMTRSGTIEEKTILFNSMLKFKAFEEVPSTKRGHKLGEKEKLVEQAVRVATNVKNRQTKAQDTGMELLESKIEKENLLQHKVLLFLLEPGQVDKNIAGLVANKYAPKYMRPCCVLTRVGDKYQGSARGCDKVGINNFKDICNESGVINWAAGHQGAFGLSIDASAVPAFLKTTDILLMDMPDEPIYKVDFIYSEKYNCWQDILDIASLEDLWGKDMDEPLIAIAGVSVTSDIVTLMSPDKKPTLKIVLPNRISLIKFNSSQEEYDKFNTEGYLIVDFIGKANKNEWMGRVTPQIFIEDYEIKEFHKYCF